MTNQPPRSITVLGSTGSVGTQTIALLAAAPERYRVRALVAGRNVARLAEQAVALRAEFAVVSDPAGVRRPQQALAGTGIEVGAGPEAVIEAASRPADWTMAAITGAAGLASTLAAIRRGACVALANKEALVCAGEVMLARSARPAPACCRSIPSTTRSSSPSPTATTGRWNGSSSPPRAARSAPPASRRWPAPPPRRRSSTRSGRWARRSRIDSATMMNKGLEVIEAARLFDLAETAIDVLVHPQSVIHGMVCYQDGSVLAQLGSPDMRIPIAHTLAWPERIAHRLAPARPRRRRADWISRRPIRSASRRCAWRARRLRAGGGAPAILSAANEVAVEAFLARRIGFLDIAATVEACSTRMGAPAADTLDERGRPRRRRARLVATELVASRARHDMVAAS